MYGVRRVSCAWEGAGGGGRDVYVLQSIPSTYVQRADHRRCSEIEIEIAGVEDLCMWAWDGGWMLV